MCFDILNRLGVDHVCDRQTTERRTDGRTEPLTTLAKIILASQKKNISALSLKELTALPVTVSVLFGRLLHFSPAGPRPAGGDLPPRLRARSTFV